MSNYNEKSLSGVKWTRSHKIVIDNPYIGTPSITFYEQDVVSSPDIPNVSIVPTQTILTKNYVQGEAIDIIDPTTGLPTGETISSDTLYATIYSLYIKVATERDNK